MVDWVSRITIDEAVVEKLTFAAKDAETLDMEVSLSKKVGKYRTKNIKVEYPPDSAGLETDADQSGQGVATSREEKVSSLKTVSTFCVLNMVDSSYKGRNHRKLKPRRFTGKSFSLN